MVYGDTAKPSSYFTWVEKINQSYCDVHRYEYAVDRRENIRSDRHGNWTKVESFKENLHDCDYLFWIDADACFYSHNIAIHEEILPLMQDKKILCPVNICGEDFRFAPNNASTGIMLFQNSELTHNILEDWNNMTDNPDFEHLLWEGTEFEQGGLNEYIIPKYKNFIKVHREYHLFHTLNGTFIRHIHQASGMDRWREFCKTYKSPIMKRNVLLLNKTES